ncbi:MAG: glycosyltransferase family 2 protein [Peptococcaceae bacterium]
MCAPLVTIGIINYNCRKFLENCLNSFLNQSYKNMEIIIIDDCSTDGSVDFLQKLEEKTENIRCIYHQVNSGSPVQGIQEIIKEAKGKYFQWIASDDYVEGNLMQEFVDYLEETGQDYVYCNFNIVNENNAVTAYWNYTVPTLEEMVYKIFTRCSGIIPMNGLYKTEFFRRNEITWSIYRDNEYSSDTINSLYFAKHGLKYGLVNKSLLNYRVHSDNYSHKIERRIKTSVTVYDFIIKNFNEEIYFPRIPWINCEYREQLKSYTIAAFYYDKIQSYLRLEGLPYYIKSTITTEYLQDSLQVFVAEGLQHIQTGLTQGEALKSELTQLQEKYKSIF